MTELLHTATTIAMKSATLGAGLLAADKLGLEDMLSGGSDMERLVKKTAYLISIEYGVDLATSTLGLGLPNLHTQSDFGLLATAGSTALSIYILDQVDLRDMIINTLGLSQSDLVGYICDGFVYAVAQELALILLRKFYSQ